MAAQVEPRLWQRFTWFSQCQNYTRELMKLSRKNSRQQVVFVYLQFNSFVPMDYVATQSKWFGVNNMYIAFFSAHIKPFTAHRKMNVCDTVGEWRILNFFTVFSSSCTFGSLTFLAETLANALQLDFSFDSSKSGSYRPLWPSRMCPRSPRTQSEQLHKLIHLRDGRARLRQAFPI